MKDVIKINGKLFLKDKLTFSEFKKMQPDATKKDFMKLTGKIVKKKRIIRK